MNDINLNAGQFELIEVESVKEIKHEAVLYEQAIKKSIEQSCNNIKSANIKLNDLLSQGFWASNTSKAKNIKSLAENLIKTNDNISQLNDCIRALGGENAKTLYFVYKLFEQTSKHRHLTNQNILNITPLIESLDNESEEIGNKVDEIESNLSSVIDKTNKIQQVDIPEIKKNINSQYQTTQIKITELSNKIAENESYIYKVFSDIEKNNKQTEILNAKLNIQINNISEESKKEFYSLKQIINSQYEDINQKITSLSNVCNEAINISQRTALDMNKLHSWKDQTENSQRDLFKQAKRLKIFLFINTIIYFLITMYLWLR